MQRVLEIEKFRNLGITDKETLVLNNSIELGKMGNLVLVIGANNSGKSNVLDALYSFGCGKMNSNDITDLSFNEKDKKPRLSLITKDAKYRYGYSFDINSRVTIEWPNEEESITEEICDQNLTVINALIDMCEKLALRDWIEKLKELKSIYAVKVNAKYKQAENELLQIIFKICEYGACRHGVRNNLQTIIDKFSSYEIIKKYKTNENINNQLAVCKNDYKKKFMVDLCPKIVKYEEKQITTAMLNCDYNSISLSQFFNAVLTAIGERSETILAAYKNFSSTLNRGVLQKLENALNRKIKAIAKNFNEMYYLNEDTYKFELKLDNNKIFMCLYKNDNAIDLNKQSTGFKWYFNLYFNLLCKNLLSAGDIIIMDEPATNLHVQGQIELRKSLKDFAIKNDITIVIATHSPFLIDLDYLDELRIIQNDGTYSHIKNDFSAMDLDNANSLDPVIEALTVSNYILVNPDKKVVFVEGITDYNYMTAFKKCLGMDDLVFLPIKGVGKTKEERLNRSKELIKFKKNGILMTDGDVAGKKMKETNKVSDLMVFTLSDVDENFIEIESLFDDDDAKKYNIVDDNGIVIKSSKNSALFKTFEVDKMAFSETTKNNFKKVFDYIESL
jgi:predicted ATPase